MTVQHIAISYTNRFGNADVLRAYKDRNWSQIRRDSDGMLIARGSSDRAQELIDNGKV